MIAITKELACSVTCGFAACSVFYGALTALVPLKMGVRINPEFSGVALFAGCFVLAASGFLLVGVLKKAFNRAPCRIVKSPEPQ